MMGHHDVRAESLYQRRPGDVGEPSLALSTALGRRGEPQTTAAVGESIAAEAAAVAMATRAPPLPRSGLPRDAASSP